VTSLGILLEIDKTKPDCLISTGRKEMSSGGDTVSSNSISQDLEPVCDVDFPIGHCEQNCAPSSFIIKPNGHRAQTGLASLLLYDPGEHRRHLVQPKEE